jgi:hypothetical protein
MLINLKKLSEYGFHVHIDKDAGIVEISPENRHDISDDLMKLCDLPRKACWDVQELIHELQIWDAIKKS